MSGAISLRRTSQISWTSVYENRVEFGSSPIYGDRKRIGQPCTGQPHTGQPCTGQPQGLPLPYTGRDLLARYGFYVHVYEKRPYHIRLVRTRPPFMVKGQGLPLPLTHIY